MSSVVELPADTVEVAATAAASTQSVAEDVTQNGLDEITEETPDKEDMAEKGLDEITEEIQVQEESVDAEKGAEEKAPFKPKLPNAKHLILIAGLLLIGGSIGLIVFAADGSLKPGGICKNISEMARTDLTLAVAPIPAIINHCRKCEFDVKTCDGECPIGFRTDENECPMDCICKVDGIFQGDIQLMDNVEQMVKLYGKLNEEKMEMVELVLIEQIWNIYKSGENYQVPYRFAPSLKNSTHKIIMNALQKFTLETCLEFVPATNQEFFILFEASEFCSGSFGRGNTGTVVKLNEKYCLHSSAIQQLVMLSLGMIHEHVRPDRDDHIEIKKDEIRPGHEPAFLKLKEEYWLDLMVDYNPMSLMHFPNDAFAKHKHTIKGKGGAKVKGRDNLYEGMQDSDVLKVNRRYQCKGYELETNWGPWGAFKMDKGNVNCLQNRVCLNSNKRRSVGCPGDSVHENEDHTKCLTSDDEEAEPDKAGRKMGKFAGSGRAEVEEMFSESIYLSDQMCMNGDLLVGKFNSDRRDDLICVFNDGWIRMFRATYDGKYKYLDWEGQTKYCRFAPDGSQRLVGDVDGDGIDDLVCRRADGTVEVTLFFHDLFPNLIEWTGMFPKCKAPDVATLKDINGDGKVDMICGDSDYNRFREVYMNTY